MHGSIAEILIYDKSLDVTERSFIESYLMKKWQHGLDGINTTGLVAHYDASKAQSLLTGTTGCTSSSLYPASNSQIPECWRDRSAMDNHLLLAAGDTPTLTTSSSMMSGQRAVSFDPGEFGPL